MPNFKDAVARRFWSRVLITGEDECWEWTGRVGKGKTDKGRAVFVVEGLGWCASRIAWALANDADPEEMHVLHSCDNGLCVNPAHLRLGTNAENILDKVNRGRQPRGETHGSTKANDEQRAEILRRYIAGEMPEDLAEEFGLCPASIRQATRRKTWKYIPVDEEALRRARWEHELERRRRSGRKKSLPPVES